MSIGCIRFIVIDSRVDIISLLPCCEEFIFNIKVQLKEYFNLFYGSKQDENTIFSILFVSNNKVEVILKPTRIELLKIHTAIDNICVSKVSSGYNTLDPSIRALKMIYSCLQKFPLDFTAINVCYIACHTFKNLSQQELDLSLSDLSSTNENLFIEFYCLEENEIYPINYILEDTLRNYVNCSLTKLSFNFNNFDTIFKKWLCIIIEQEIQISFGSIILKCKASQKIIDIQPPHIKVCNCHFKPVIGRNDICSESMNKVSSVSSVLSFSQTTKVQERKDNECVFYGIHKIPLNSISEDNLYGDCFIVTPEIIYGEYQLSQFYCIAELLRSSDLGLVLKTNTDIQTFNINPITSYYILMARSDNQCFLMRKLVSKEQQINEIISSHTSIEEEELNNMRTELNLLDTREYDIENYPSGYHSYITTKIKPCQLKQRPLSETMKQLRKNMAKNSREIANNLSSLRKRTRAEFEITK